jgi:hypothetical protein
MSKIKDKYCGKNSGNSDDSLVISTTKMRLIPHIKHILNSIEFLKSRRKTKIKTGTTTKIAKSTDTKNTFIVFIF